MENKLSICIPTYNRCERLLGQLRSLYRQEGFSDVRILVLDNCSEFDVERAIIDEFGIIPSLKVIRHKENLGGEANMALTFFFCETPWMWLLGDDDESDSSAIRNILQDIQERPEVLAIKYSVSGFYPNKDTEVNSLPSFIDYYFNGRNTCGEMIFLSNNVYNMQKILPFCKDILLNTYCRVPQLLPIFHALQNRAGVVRFSSIPVVSYLPPTNGTGWNFLSVAHDITSLLYLDFDLEQGHISRLADVLMQNFTHLSVIITSLEYADRKRGRVLYMHIFRDLFKYQNCFVRMCYYILYDVYYRLGLSAKKIKTLQNWVYIRTQKVL